MLPQGSASLAPLAADRYAAARRAARAGARLKRMTKHSPNPNRSLILARTAPNPHLSPHFTDPNYKVTPTQVRAGAGASCCVRCEVTADEVEVSWVTQLPSAS